MRRASRAQHLHRANDVQIVHPQHSQRDEIEANVNRQFAMVVSHRTPQIPTGSFDDDFQTAGPQRLSEPQPLKVTLTV